MIFEKLLYHFYYSFIHMYTQNTLSLFSSHIAHSSLLLPSLIHPFILSFSHSPLSLSFFLSLTLSLSLSHSHSAETGEAPTVKTVANIMKHIVYDNKDYLSVWRREYTH